eukprot:808879-Rhodomonas_salina.1
MGMGRPTSSRQKTLVLALLCVNIGPRGQPDTGSRRLRTSASMMRISITSAGTGLQRQKSGWRRLGKT